ncbi:MAG: hypothetical protein HYV04_00155 [Deltaproteobacteria bacterium]|nr:hypothetical protein [Deltaproteobacteria bacterium]
MMRARKSSSYALLLILCSLPFLTSFSPQDETEIDALALAELIAEGFDEPTGIAIDSSGRSQSRL